ncbi:CehA/McbA family metallohydrolase [Pseudomarimonas salicorniae]|uniref:CehA/McbA family metallohydrolase n=1 Tax=Pseudomarimonas salicorniae TaxID=2933270 RepID=A0ABT0GGQ6_9GAMM|nr:CehA/McbA family metallohydrolase [Lysobacter sp. CAU 1642]MCK7593724.1 CehA/McbA family metallohydrolase [Lysobacter sp. CAU 1642]
MALVLTLAAGNAWSQWIHRYAKLSDFGHHIYLEQHELPFVAHGPIDPAASPLGGELALAAQGWIWILDLESGVARRITSGAAVDSRPRWSPDGQRLAFIRDDGADTAIVVRDLASGSESVVNTPAIELDPEFSADGVHLYYSSGRGEVLSLWRRHLAAGTDERLTDLPQVERNARRLPDGSGLLYLHGDGPTRALRLRDFLTGTDLPVRVNSLTYHLTADVHPSERVIVFSSPTDNDYHLYTMDLDRPGPAARLTDGTGYALTPAFSADGSRIYYVEPDARQQFQLKQIPTFGGTPQPVEIRRWDHGVELGTLVVETRDVGGELQPARLAIREAGGHPVATSHGPTFFDSQTGRHYFYSPGRVELQVPVGGYEIIAARGPMTLTASAQARVSVKSPAQASLVLRTLWSATEAGYVSVDQHVHLNGDGQHRATHEDMLRLLAGEDLDQINPMSWNRWERGIDIPLIGKQSERDGHVVDQSQEVRSHFHGHVGLARTDEVYRPWFWGPTNPRFGSVDQSNGSAIAFAERQGGFATYVHPLTGDGDPFIDPATSGIPLELVADGVLTERLGLEIVCAWTSPLGNSELWYRFLNIGRPMAAMSGTDAWADFHRTPAMGTARTYVRRPAAGEGYDAVLDASIAGRSFVTTGPALEFELGDGAQPGDVVAAGEQRWRAKLASATAVDRFEIVVNGEVVHTAAGVEAGKTRTLEGSVRLPAGGWVAARVYASEVVDDPWPSMAKRPFAHSSPIWIGEVGSVDPSARARASADLLRALDAAGARYKAAYGDTPMPTMQTRFDAARAKLAELATVPGADR